jgi:hypothetical protein
LKNEGLNMRIILKMVLKDKGWNGLEWIDVANERDR